MITYEKINNGFGIPVNMIYFYVVNESDSAVGNH